MVTDKDMNLLHIQANWLKRLSAVVFMWTVPFLVYADSHEKAGLSFNLTDFTGLGEEPAPLEALLLSVLEVFIIIATPIIVLYIIYAGFLYVTAQGNATQVQTATRALTYAVIGAVLILGAVAIAAIIQGVVGEFRV